MLKKLLNSVSVVLILALVFSIFACAPLSVSAAETDTLADIGADHDPAEASAAANDLFGELSSGRYALTSRTYQLTADVALEGYLYVPSGVTA